MRITLLLLLLSAFVSNAQTNDEEAIKKVILTSYISGIQNRGSAEDIRKGFDPGFTMLRLIDNQVKPLPIEEWITNIEKQKASNEPAPPPAEGKFINVDITGNAAVVKLDLYRSGKRTFTDYLVLYKFNEGWKIVSKTFYRYP
ncbi:nuclear transport factor 2 family protein [Chryseosolibacter indicus]|uniref:Nuclear transport factor 2 family protein n=1 Tax=Chryseosolibacter indicus TaxID=2782351 RepID=A0ABS5VY75_9BACT|nr:nuclear transport factor 2 family protein [Chryseosolibacter indicus]MBT1706362.1 nuclear transport factor 2 family protein [Chryseosolibacter indicus]